MKGSRVERWWDCDTVKALEEIHVGGVKFGGHECGGVVIKGGDGQGVEYTREVSRVNP